jgi:DNA repair exonuclease SbcCD ATPase subunit
MRIRWFVALSSCICSFLCAQQYYGQQNYNGQQYGQPNGGYNGQQQYQEIPGLAAGEGSLSETGADRQIADIDKQIQQLQRKAQQLQDQGQKCEQQANQIFFYDAMRARTLIHEAESYQAQAQETEQQIVQLQNKKQNLQMYAN